MSNTLHQVIVFDKKLNDWIILKDGFKNEEDAQKFLDDYPRFGNDYSRTIREGNGQVIPS